MDTEEDSSPGEAEVGGLQALQRLERENAHLRAQLQEATGASERLTSMVSHELRTPLQAISIAVEVSLRRIQGSADDLPREWLLEKLERTKRLVGRLDQLIRTFLNASQISSGRLRADVEQLDLSEVIRGVVNRFTDDLTWAGCPCQLVIPPHLVGRWDPLHLELILSNLLSNAAKYANGRPVEIRLLDQTDRVQLSVRDQGPGIEPHLQDKLFQRFTRLPSESKMSGFGLGLWIVKHLAEAHEGGVQVDSAPGRGTTFVVDLPRWTPKPA